MSAATRMSRYAHYPKLWRDDDKDRDQRNCADRIASTADTSENKHFGATESFLRARSVPSTDLVSLEVQRPPPRELMDIINNAMVVGQEFVLASLFLARHRDAIEEWESHTTKYGESKQMLSMVVVALVAVFISYNSQTSSDQKMRCISAKGKRKHILVRVSDAIILAAILRFLASVLRTLTASYSSDTVNALAIGGMVVHLLACDYSYALGISTKGNDGDGGDGQRGSTRRLHTGRPTFSGGTVSLNAALFSTTLLASRLPTNAMSYAFISSSVILFAFYPAARHAIAARQTQASKYVFGLCCSICLVHILFGSHSLANLLIMMMNFSWQKHSRRVR